MANKQGVPVSPLSTRKTVSSPKRRRSPHTVTQPKAAALDPVVFADRGLSKRFGVSESNLELRRQFIRLTPDDRSLLTKLEPWAARVALSIAKEFYDWQFSFAPTLTFFENFSRARQTPLPVLREIA